MLQAVDTYITLSMTNGVACCPRLVSRSAYQARPSCFTVSAVILGLNLLGDALSDYYDRAGR